MSTRKSRRKKAKCNRWLIEFKENVPNVTKCLTPKQEEGGRIGGKRVAFMTRVYTEAEKAEQHERALATKRTARRRSQVKGGIGIGTVLVLGGIATYFLVRK